MDKIMKLYLLIIILVEICDAKGGEQCPNVCHCKWKGGKQTVECIEKSLYTIPEHIDSETQVLDMSENNLQILPKETFKRLNLLNLQKLYLRSCRLGQIDDEAFKGLTNLVELDLSNNLLTTIPSLALQEISSLRDLIFASNPIQKIESHAYRYVPNLVKLDMSHCEIQMIAPQAFEGLSILHALKLNGNKLSELRPRTVETLSKLHGVELHDNPWLCDCRLRAAKLWLTENNIPYPVPPICSGGPERVIDRSFAELTVDDFACKPEMLPMRRYIEAATGDNATIICRASAIPSANINWYWNGRLLSNNSAFSSYQKVYVFEEGTFEKRSRLVLTNAQETDSSEFYCVVENRAGTAEANFTLHVAMRAPGITALGNKQIVGLSAVLVIIILCILLITLFLLVRLRRIPMSESKTPGQLEIITTVNPTSMMNGKITTPINDINSPNEKNSSELKFANPVQKPPRLTDIPYSTAHYDGNGSLIAGGNCFLSPTHSAGNNPDLINDTKQQNNELTTGLDTSGLSANVVNALNTLQLMDQIERPGSGEYSRAGNDSLYPSGLWENHNNASSTASLEKASDILLKRTSANNSGYTAYSDKIPIIGHNNNTMNLDDETSSIDYISRTFPRTAHQLSSSSHISSNNNNNNNSSHNHNNNNVGYPSDYGLPIVPGAEQLQNKLNSVQPTHHSSTGHVPMNAKTLRVWQKGGVPVLPPVTALKRALTNSRNSPDEGYQEGCGTDV